MVFPTIVKKIPPEGVDDVTTVSTGAATKSKRHGGHTVEPGSKNHTKAFNCNLAFSYRQDVHQFD